MKQVCSCGAKFNTDDELWSHINAQMGTDYSPKDFEILPLKEGEEEPEEPRQLTDDQKQRLAALLSSPHHGYTTED